MPSPNRTQPTTDRYTTDVLAAGWQQRAKKVVPEVVLERGLVLEDAATGFCGAVTRWENGLVVLEGRGDKRRSFPIGHGLLLEGKPVLVKAPARKPSAAAGGRTSGRTVSGSVVGPAEKAKVALPSRIYVEGRHDAELVEKIWGDDLRHVGVVVEFMDGIDDLSDIVAEFRPERGRRLGVLADHLVPGSKESRIAAGVAKGPYGSYVLVAGHPFVDIWQAVKPARLGLPSWPHVPRGTDIKHGTCAALGWPHRDQADIARAWQRILARVTSWNDLERALLTPVEQLIDFVTQDHLA
ncbi:MAG TPA: DUF3097 domain-containing protein [Microlunatus sp.]|nr:DUF3097 domain-containing protein [Microlunatus sp.]